MDKRFRVIFIKKSLQEYQSLDHSIIAEVDAALESLEERADEVGKPLDNKREYILAGTKEKKLRSSGIRIIYQIRDEQVEVLRIVVILLIGFKKNESQVYDDASNCYQTIRDHGLSLPAEDNPDLWWNSEQEMVEDVFHPSMIDEIFDDFDFLEDVVKEEILALYQIGDVRGAYQVWLSTKH